MRITTRSRPRGYPATRNGETLPDGVGGTITGGPMQAIDLLEILNRATRGVSRAGAVSGAAQVAVSSPGAGEGRDRDIALSDGSRISFASVEDRGARRDDSAGLFEARGSRQLTEV
jgi:hypothetical protein